MPKPVENVSAPVLKQDEQAITAEKQKHVEKLQSIVKTLQDGGELSEKLTKSEVDELQRMGYDLEEEHSNESHQSHQSQPAKAAETHSELVRPTSVQQQPVTTTQVAEPPKAAEPVV